MAASTSRSSAVLLVRKYVRAHVTITARPSAAAKLYQVQTGGLTVHPPPALAAGRDVLWAGRLAGSETSGACSCATERVAGGGVSGMAAIRRCWRSAGGSCGGTAWARRSQTAP